MASPALIDLNPVELNYHPLMISLDKCNGRCNAIDDLSMKICSKTNKRQILKYLI